MFNPDLVVFTTLTKIGPVEPGPAGAMADYSMSAYYGDITKEMAFKVLHDVMNPNEPDPTMYEMAEDMAKRVLLGAIQSAVTNRERDDLIKRHSEGSLGAEGIRLGDIQFSELQRGKHVVTLAGTFLGHTMYANSNREEFERSEASGLGEKAIEDMKFSLLHAFQAAHRRISLNI